MPFPLHPQLGEVYRRVRLSVQLEKTAQEKPGTEVAEQAARIKVALDDSIFATIKNAGVGQWLTRAMENPLGKGLAMGTGVAIPAVAGGAYLLGRAEDKAKATTEDVRNKVLQSALGLAGIGAGMYGLHRLTGGGPLFTEGAAPKQASADNDTLSEDAIQKLAVVAVIDDMLDTVETVGDSETLKLAQEVRVLNRGYGIRILYELCHE